MPEALHPEIESLLDAAVTGGLSPDERRAFEEHLAGCAGCRQRHHELLAVDQTINSSFSSWRPQPDFADRLVATFRDRLTGARSEPTKESAPVRGRFPGLAWAGGTILGMLLTAVLVIPGLLRERETSVSLSAHGPPRSGNPTVSGYAPNMPPTQRNRAASRGDDAALGGDSPSREEPQTLVVPPGAPPSSKSLGENRVAETLPAPAPSSSRKPAQTETPAPPADRDPDLVEPPAGAPPPPGPDPGTDRKLVRNAEVSLEVARYQLALDALTPAVQAAGGYVETNESERRPNGKLTGTAVVKVLPAQLDRFLLRLRELGTVTKQELTTEDVTKAYFDADAHLRNSRRLEARLVELLKESRGKLSELLEVEKELARVRGEVEALQGELRLYDHQIRFATVTVHLSEKDLDQPTAFLRRRTVNLRLSVARLTAVYQEIQHLADEEKLVVKQAELTADKPGQPSSADFSLQVPPAKAGAVITRLRATGKTDAIDQHEQRVPKETAGDGTGEESGPGTGTADAPVESDGPTLEQAPVELKVHLAEDEGNDRIIRLSVVVKNLAGAFDQAKQAAAGQGARITSAALDRSREKPGQGTVTAVVPANQEADLVGRWRGLGDLVDAELKRRPGATTTDGGGGAARIELTLLEEAVPRQRTGLRLAARGVEGKLDALRRAAAQEQWVVRGVSFEQGSGGEQRGLVTLRVPLDRYPEVLARLRALGTVQDMTVTRQEQPDHDPGIDGGSADRPAGREVAEIDLQLRDDPAHPLENGSGPGGVVLWAVAASARFVLGAAQFLGLALIFLLPWAALGLLGWWLLRRFGPGRSPFRR